MDDPALYFGMVRKGNDPVEVVDPPVAPIAPDPDAELGPETLRVELTDAREHTTGAAPAVDAPEPVGLAARLAAVTARGPYEAPTRHRDRRVEGARGEAQDVVPSAPREPQVRPDGSTETERIIAEGQRRLAEIEARQAELESAINRAYRDAVGRIERLQAALESFDIGFTGVAEPTDARLDAIDVDPPAAVREDASPRSDVDPTGPEPGTPTTDEPRPVAAGAPQASAPSIAAALQFAQQATKRSAGGGPPPAAEDAPDHPIASGTR